jgi:hypothetical protein
LYETNENWEMPLREESIFYLLHKDGVELDVNDFIGKGVSIYFCEEIGIYNDEDFDDDDGNLRVQRDGKEYVFWINNSSADFPLIEGSFTPGIYWEEDELTYFELRDLQDISRLFSDFLMLILSTEAYKVICHENGAEMRALADNSLIRDVKRFPLNYFDVYCPFCRETVHTHEIKSEHYPQCLQIETPCSHYIGKAVKGYDKFHKRSLEDIGIIYKIEDQDLYMETATGWQQLTVYDPPFEPEKFYYGDAQPHFRDVFLFLEV